MFKQFANHAASQLLPNLALFITACLYLSFNQAALAQNINDTNPLKSCTNLFPVKHEKQAQKMSSETLFNTNVPELLQRAINRFSDKNYLEAFYQIDYLTQTGELQNFENRSAIFTNCLLPIYQNAIDQAYERNRPRTNGENDSTDVFIKLALRIGEASRQAQIEMSIPDACDRLDRAFSLDDLLPKETIIYPIIGTAHIYVLVGKKTDAMSQGSWMVHMLSQHSSLPSLVDGLIENMKYISIHPSAENVKNDAHVALSQIYTIFGFDKILSNSAQYEHGTLIIFPDPSLNSIPWPALHQDGSNSNKFLIQTVAIAIAPGLAYTQPKKTKTPDRIFVAGGELNYDIYTQARDILGNSIKKFSCSALSKNSSRSIYNTSKENKPVNACLDNTIIDPERHFRLSVDLEETSGEKFTKKNLIGNGNAPDGFSENAGLLYSSSYQAIYISAHAVFGKNNQSYIMTVEENVSIGELRSLVKYKTNRGQEIDLLVLASCDGAARSTGDLGIAGVALQSGIPTVIGVLYAIDKESPNTLLFAPKIRGERLSPEGFWDYLYEGKGSAEALRQAQLRSIADSESSTVSKNGKKYLSIERKNFANWSAFVVVGNWR